MFSDADVKSIFRNITVHGTQLLQPPPYIDLVSGGLVLEHHVKERIKNAILSQHHETGRISLLQLASSAGIELRKVEALLPSESTEWGRVGHSTIITKSEYRILQRKLERTLENTAIRKTDFCRVTNIDTECFLSLLSSCQASSSLRWLGHDSSIVYQDTVFESLSSEVVGLLETQGPVSIDTLFPGRSLPREFILHLVRSNLRQGNINGVLKGTTFISSVHQETKRKEVIEKLKRDGFIDTESLEEGEIGNSETISFKPLPLLHHLGSHVVTDTFLNELCEVIKSELEASGWAQVKTLDARLDTIAEKRLRSLILQRQVNIEEYATYFISGQLKNTLLQRALEFSKAQAESRFTSPASHNGTLKRHDLFNYLSGASSLPPAATNALLEEIVTTAFKAYTDHLIILRDAAIAAAKSNFVGKCYARFKVHHAALQVVGDKSLRMKLSADLLQYSRELALSNLDKLDATVNKEKVETYSNDVLIFRQFLQAPTSPSSTAEDSLRELEFALEKFMVSIGTLKPTENELLEKKSEMLKELSSQAQKAKDSSLLLTLVLIILHAKLHAGVLKASGKYVPKLLKHLQSQIDQPLYDFLLKVKNLIIAQSEISDSDLQKLGMIYSGCTTALG